jgi:hypothetical protein
MAIVNCPECGNKISQNAEICPSCGVKSDPKALSTLAKEKEEKSKKSNERIIKWSAILIGLFLTTHLLAGSFDKTSTDSHCEYSERLAYVYLEKMGKKYFSAPSTVKFVPIEEAAKVEKLDCHNYRIVTYADAQNALGGTVRSVVSAKVSFNGYQANLEKFETYAY